MHKRPTAIFLLILVALAVTPAVGFADYQGTVRVYVVEPISRWSDANDDPYEYGFLDFAIETDIDIGSSTPWQQTIVWDANTVNLGPVTESNIMAMAAVFNANGETRDAVPEYGYWFTAYPVDASAAAYPGIPGQNSASGGYTHTVYRLRGS